MRVPIFQFFIFSSDLAGTAEEVFSGGLYGFWAVMLPANVIVRRSRLTTASAIALRLIGSELPVVRICAAAVSIQFNAGAGALYGAMHLG
jgi:hypothetical protein